MRSSMLSPRGPRIHRHPLKSPSFAGGLFALHSQSSQWPLWTALRSFPKVLLLPVHLVYIHPLHCNPRIPRPRVFSLMNIVSSSLQEIMVYIVLLDNQMRSYIRFLVLIKKLCHTFHSPLEEFQVDEDEPYSIH